MIYSLLGQKSIGMEAENIPQSVLVVDDSALNIRVISNIISPLGYSIHTAKSGVNALKFLTEHSPDIILMDIRMPKMDGFECCARIKSIASRAHIPIIFISGSHDLKDQQKSIDLGASAYLTKPIDPELLIKTIQESSIYIDNVLA